MSSLSLSLNNNNNFNKNKNISLSTSTSSSSSSSSSSYQNNSYVNNISNLKILNKKLVARALFNMNEEIIAIVIINGYDVKNYIEQNLSEPATGFIRYNNIENALGELEIKNCNTMYTNKKDTKEINDNLLFSLKLKPSELNDCKLKKHPEGCQIITYIGIYNVHNDKWHRNSCGLDGNLLNPIDNTKLKEEMETTRKSTHSYLTTFCEETLRNPISTLYGPINYTLILQKRYLSNVGLKKFEGILSLADRVHRKSYDDNTIMENLENWD